MKYSIFSRWLLVGLAFTIIMVSACKKDDDDVPPMIEDPVAAFSFTVTDFEVSFTNMSTNASSYSWDFGDGETSSEKDPKYTFKSSGDFAVKLTATNSGNQASNAITQTVSIADPYKSSGYFVTSSSFSSAGGSVFGGYFESMPTGDIDLTQYQSFGNMILRAQSGQFLYGRPSDGVSNGVVKYGIDAKTNQLVEVATIPTLQVSGTIVIINETLGFYGGGNELVVYTFNPTTMENIGSIDLSTNSPLPAENRNGVISMLYNEKTGKLLVPLYSDDENTGQFYDDDEIHIEVIDVATQTREKTISHPEAEYIVFRGTVNPVIDDLGNTYFIAHGTYGLDLQIGPTAPKGSRPQIVKVDANSEFDTTYAWNPINGIGFENNFFQLFVSLVKAEGNKAYGIGTAGPESPEIVALLQKLATGTITAAEFSQLQILVFSDESMQVIEIDLTAKTATAVSGMPFTAGFGYPYMYNYDGKVFTQMTSNGGTFNGFYNIDPATNIASPQFNITQGGLAFQLMKIGN